jgi:Tol biopolymer transport system component
MDIWVDENGKVQSSEAVKLISSSIRPGYISWSPNGDKIAYAKSALDYIEEAPFSIWFYNVADGSTEKIYTPTDDLIYHLTWSPDGTKLAFVRNPDSTDTTDQEPIIEIFDIATKSLEVVWTFPKPPNQTTYYSYYHGLDWANNDDKLAFFHSGGLTYWT